MIRLLPCLFVACFLGLPQRAQAESGLLGHYFDNPFLNGDPVVVEPLLTMINDWGSGAPTAGVPEDFSARFTGLLTPPVDGAYTFSLKTDDGVRVWFNGHLVHDFWRGQAPAKSNFEVDLQSGVPIEVVIEYFDDHGGATLHLYWSGPVSSGPIPIDAFKAVPVDLDDASVPLLPIPASGIAVKYDKFGTTSPAFFECASGSEGATLRAYALHLPHFRLKPIPTSPLGAGRAYGDVDLDSRWPTILFVTDGSSITTRLLHWRSLSPSSGASALLVRVGDAVLLPPKQRAKVTDPYTKETLKNIGRGKRTLRFDEAGDFEVDLLDQRGHLDRTVLVTAASASIPRIAAEINFAKHVTFDAEPRGDLINLSASTDLALSHIELPSDRSKIEVLVKPLGRGSPFLVARLSGALGPILDVREVDEFTLVSDFSDGSFGWRETDGFIHANFGFTLDPVIDYLEIDVEFIVHNAKVNGLSHFQVPASAIGTDGHWSARLLVSGKRLLTCHRLTAIQLDESK